MLPDSEAYQLVAIKGKLMAIREQASIYRNAIVIKRVWQYYSRVSM